MPIPFYGQLSALIFLVVFGGVLAITVFFAWKQRLEQRKEPLIDTILETKDRRSDHSLLTIVLGTMGAMTFLFGGGTILYLGASETNHFLNLPLTQIRALKISLIVSNKTNTAEFIKFDDRTAVQNALKQLSGCTVFQRNREELSNGFRIEVLFDDENIKGNELLVFLNINPPNGEFGVVNPRGPADINLGSYSCPEFDVWVRENIVTLFPNPTAN